MNRRQLAFVVIFNALISLAIAVAVVWVVELRRPDPETLAALTKPVALPPVAATFTPTAQAVADAQPAAAQPTAAPTPLPQTGEGNAYTVQTGDSLSGIADRFGVSVSAIIETNKLDNPDFVFVGQRLVIPSPVAGSAATGQQATATPAAAGTQGIRISAINSPGNLASEAAAVVNDSDLAMNLQGWKLEQEGGAAYTIGNVLLFPGSGVLIYSGVGTDTSVALYWNQPAAVWQAGAVARLLNAQGAEVARFVVQ